MLWCLLLFKTILTTSHYNLPLTLRQMHVFLYVQVTFVCELVINSDPISPLSVPISNGLFRFPSNSSTSFSLLCCLLYVTFIIKILFNYSFIHYQLNKHLFQWCTTSAGGVNLHKRGSNGIKTHLKPIFDFTHKFLSI